MFLIIISIVFSNNYNYYKKIVVKKNINNSYKFNKNNNDKNVNNNNNNNNWQWNNSNDHDEQHWQPAIAMATSSNGSE